MPKTLVIAEKPSVAMDIARVLKCGQKGEGCVSSEAYIVTWAVGHLLTLCEPEDYDAALKRWNMDALPIIPGVMRLKPIPAVNKQLNTVRRLMNSREVDRLICATDSGREGELIFRYIYEFAECRKPFARLWISSMTDAAIRHGFDNLKNGEEYDDLYNAAKCRSEADWLVGINATRAYTIRYNALLSIGRVQTPTLAILAARQAEIERFVPADYWEVAALFSAAENEGYNGVWFDPKTKSSVIGAAEEAARISEAVSGAEGFVESVETARKRQPPPLLYDLTELQRDCVRRFGFSAQRTLDIAQDLYEKRKVITYPRTDSRYLSVGMAPKALAALKKLSGLYPDEIAGMPPPVTPLSRRVADDSRVTDHHAIIPNGHVPDMSAFTQDERRVYDLIARRFIAVFYPDYVIDAMKAVTAVKGERFVSRGTAVVQWGWNALYRDPKTAAKDGGSDQDSDQDGDAPPLPSLRADMPVSALSAQSIKKQTKPPPYYNEATLLSAMEHAGNKAESAVSAANGPDRSEPPASKMSGASAHETDAEALAELMKASSLGTPATRAAIIERLLSVGYVARRGKSLIVLEKGMKLVRILPEELVSPITTGKWEKGLDSIARGKLDPERFMESIGRFVRYIVAGTDVADPDVYFERDKRPEGDKRGKPAANAPAKNKSRVPRGGKTASIDQAGQIGPCPACGSGSVLENSKAFYCSNWRDGCDFTLWKSNLPVGTAEEQRAEVSRAIKTGPPKTSPAKAAGKKRGKQT